MIQDFLMKKTNGEPYINITNISMIKKQIYLNRGKNRERGELRRNQINRFQKNNIKK